MVPADRGIVMPVSGRMNERVCRFISTVVYEGQLRSDDGADGQTLLSAQGLDLIGVVCAVTHLGSSQVSPEEIQDRRQPAPQNRPWSQRQPVRCGRLSHAFFGKGGPKNELDGLVTRAVSGDQILLPIWHNVSKREVIGYSASLADRLARSTSTHTGEETAAEIAEVVCLLNAA